MIGKRVVKEKPVPLAEVLGILEKTKKHEELEYWQRLTYDYAEKFAKPKPELRQFHLSVQRPPAALFLPSKS